MHFLLWLLPVSELTEFPWKMEVAKWPTIVISAFHSPSLLMHACKWPCQYDLPLSLPLPLFPLLKLHGSGLPPLFPPFPRPANQPATVMQSHACVVERACWASERVCMICRKWLARDSFKCSRTLGKEGSCSNKVVTSLNSRSVFYIILYPM